MHLTGVPVMPIRSVHASTSLRTGEYSSRGKQKLVGAFEPSGCALAGSFGNTLPLVICNSSPYPSHTDFDGIGGEVALLFNVG
jgi:hypothetical protein